MLEDYINALRAGQRATRAAQARGQSPYLAVLDDILRGVNIVAQEPLGLVDIPPRALWAPKRQGRHTAFAPNFMPILEVDSEFAPQVVQPLRRPSGRRHPESRYGLRIPKQILCGRGQQAGLGAQIL